MVFSFKKNYMFVCVCVCVCVCARVCGVCEGLSDLHYCKKGIYIIVKYIDKQLLSIFANFRRTSAWKDVNINP